MTDAGGRPRLTGMPAVLLVGACAAVAQAFGRFTYGVLLPAIRDDLGISNTLAGSIGTVNVGAYLVGTVVVAAITNRLKLLAVMRLGFVFSTVGLGLAAIAPNAWVLGVAMFASGFGGALIWIPSPVIGSAALAPEKRGLAVAIVGSGIGLGIVFTGQLSGWVRRSLGDDSWRTVYSIQSAMAVAVLVATLLFIGHQQERPKGQRAGLGGVQLLRTMRGWAPLTLAYASFGLMYLLVVAFLTTRLEDDSGWTSSETSIAFTMLGIATVFGGPLFVMLVRRRGARAALLVAFTSWSVLALVVLPGWFGVTLAATIGLGLLFGGIPTIITLYVVENTTIESYGPIFAAATLAFGVAQMLSPQIGGLVADLTGSFTVVFLMSAAFALVGTGAALRLPATVDADSTPTTPA